MELVSHDALVDIRASRGFVKDYKPQSNSASPVQPPNDYNIMLDMIRNDPVLWTAIDLTSDMVTYNGFDFDGKSKPLVETARKKFDLELDFDQVLKNILTQLLIYGDAYLELEYQDGKVIKVHPLETTEIKMVFDVHGEIEGYEQSPGVGSKAVIAKFTKDEVIHFRLHWIGSRVYSYSPFESLSRSYRSKLFANHFLEQIFRNLHPKIVYFLKSANREQRDNFMQQLIRAKTNPNMDLVGVGEAEAQLLQYAFDSGLIAVLDYLRREVLMVTRVPPHWIGMVEGANRGIGENVVIPFETKVKNVQHVMASVINRELMPKLALKNLVFKFNPISLMDEKLIFENAQILRGIGVTADSEHPVITYLKSKGVQLPLDAELNEEMALPKDSFSSRFSKDGKGKMGSELNKKGVSEGTREDMMEKKLEAVA